MTPPFRLQGTTATFFGGLFWQKICIERAVANQFECGQSVILEGRAELEPQILEQMAIVSRNDYLVAMFP